jgi:hypothetical protein
MRGTRNKFEILVCKPESNITLLRFMRRTNDDIILEVRDNGYDDAKRDRVVQDMEK